ncbi:hypothetical protein ACIQVK_50730 [Streptomyces sp. NPDC090493]|uniref:hypothetical protein n=1 Tax=Streptomyces sp. NPDC090493 TaxID=3365964 RepID=UPI0038236DD3
MIVQDLDSLDVLSEPLLPRPRSPFCSADGTGTPEVTHLAGEVLRAPHTEDEPGALPVGGAADEDTGRVADPYAPRFAPDSPEGRVWAGRCVKPGPSWPANHSPRYLPSVRLTLTGTTALVTAALAQLGPGAGGERGGTTGSEIPHGLIDRRVPADQLKGAA